MIYIYVLIDSNIDYRLKQDALQFLIVHTHTDPDTGDLWFEGEETGPYAAPADSFMSHILEEEVDAHRVHIIFLPAEPIIRQSLSTRSLECLRSMY